MSSKRLVGAKSSRYKVQCCLCHELFDNDYIKKHTASKHPELHRENRLAPSTIPGVVKRKNPWAACAPAKTSRPEQDMDADAGISKDGNSPAREVSEGTPCQDSAPSLSGNSEECVMMVETETDVSLSDGSDDSDEGGESSGDESDVDILGTMSDPVSEIETAESRRVDGPLDISQSVNDSPVQPILERYPKHKDGPAFRCFSSKFFNKHKWIEYSVLEDAVYCFHCRHFPATSDIESASGGSLFRAVGFRRWRKCYGQNKNENSLLKHQLSYAHLKATESFEAYKGARERGSVLSQLSDEHSKQVQENRHYLKTVCEVLLVIAKQKLALRESGSYFRDPELDPETVDYGPYSGNFLSILSLVARHDAIIANRLLKGPKNAKYTHHSVQNALIDLMADEVRKQIFNELQSAKYFALLADETKDLSKREQLSISVRYLFEGSIHEEFLTLEALEDLDADAMTEKIISFMRDRVQLENCVAQAYDGASVVSGSHAGVNALMKERVAPLGNYIHCYNHRLNLVLVDVAKSVPSVRNCLSLLQTLYVFVSCSSIQPLWVQMQKERGLKVLQLKKLCYTRWACQASMLQTVCARFTLLDELLSKVIEKNTNSDRVVEARGLQMQFTEEFLKVLFALKEIFAATKSSSDYLQNPNLDFSEALNLLEGLVDTLKQFRNHAFMKNISEKAIEIFQEIASNKKDRAGSERGRTQRARQMPTRLQNFVVDALIEQDDMSNLDDFTREMFTVIDRLLSEIERRFFKDNRVICVGVKALSPSSDSFLCDEDIFKLGQLYDSNVEDLKVEVANFKRVLARKTQKPKTLLELEAYLRTVAEAFHELYRLVQIGITLPVSTCACERSFSTLRIVKNYMRTSMYQDRLRNLMILGVHASRANGINLVGVVDNFAKKFLKSRIILI